MTVSDATTIMFYVLLSSRRNPNPTLNPNVTWSQLPPKSNGFFRGPRATFPPNFAKTGSAVSHNRANE